MSTKDSSPKPTKSTAETPAELKHPDQLETIPGVRVTRRVTLHGAFASAFMMALGTIPGCDSDEKSKNNDEGDDSSSDSVDNSDKDGDHDNKAKGNGKKKKKPKSDSKSGGKKDDKDKDSDEGQDSDEEEDGESSESDAGDDDADGDDKADNDEDSDESGGGSEDEDEDEDEDKSPLTIEQILSMIVADAQKLVKDKSIDEADYQKRVMKLLARIDPNEPVPKLQVGHGHTMRPYKTKNPIQVFVLEMAPNARIPLHDHGNRIGNLVVWRGTAKTSNYTRLEKGDNGDHDFLLQETDERELERFGCGYLSRVHNNFHVVQAGPRGCSMLDLFTYYSNNSNVPGAGSRWARLGQAVDKDKKIYKASYSQGPGGYAAHDFDD